MLRLAIVTCELFRRLYNAFRIEANPAIPDAHDRVRFTRVIDISKTTLASRSVNRDSFIKLHYGYPAALTRSPRGFSDRDHLTPQLSDSLSAPKFRQCENSLTVNSTVAHFNLSNRTIRFALRGGHSPTTMWRVAKPLYLRVHVQFSSIAPRLPTFHRCLQSSGRDCRAGFDSLLRRSTMR